MFNRFIYAYYVKQWILNEIPNEVKWILNMKQWMFSQTMRNPQNANIIYNKGILALFSFFLAPDTINMTNLQNPNIFKLEA